MVTLPQELDPPRIREAPKTKRGYYEARPGDVVLRQDLALIDVREVEDDLMGDLGHIHAAYHLPADKLERDGLPTMARNTPVVLVCQNGWRSRRCAIRLSEEFGFTEVYHLVGGMIRWVAEERPIARTRTWRSLEA